MINEELDSRDLEQKTNPDKILIEQNSSNILRSKNLTASIADQRESKSDSKNESINELSCGSQPLRNVFDPAVKNLDVEEIKDIVETIAEAVFRIIDNNFNQLANRSSNLLGMRVKDSLILKVQQTHKKKIPFDELETSLVCRLVVDDDLQFRFLPRIRSPALSSNSENLSSTRQKKSVSLADEVKVFNQVESEFFSDNEVRFFIELTDNRSDKIMDQQRDADGDEKVYDLSSQKIFTHMDSESSFDPNHRSPNELLNNEFENIEEKIIDDKTQKTNKQSNMANENSVESSVYAEEQIEHTDFIVSTEKSLISNNDVEIKFKVEQSVEQSLGSNAINVPNAEEVLRQKKITSNYNTEESIECLNIVDTTVREKSNEERRRAKEMEKLVNEFFRNYERTIVDRVGKATDQPALKSNDKDKISEKETVSDNFTTFVSEAQFNFIMSIEIDEKLNDGQISEEKKEFGSLSKYRNRSKDVKVVPTCGASQNNFDGIENKIETNQGDDTVNENNDHETSISHNSHSEDNLLEPKSKHETIVKKDQSFGRNVSLVNESPNSSTESGNVNDDEIEARKSEGIVVNYEKQSTLFSRIVRSKNRSEKNIAARETALNDDTSRINDQLSADSRRLNSPRNPEIHLEDTAEISLTYEASEGDKGQRKNVRTHPEIKSRQVEELTLSDEKLKLNLTFGTKMNSPTNFSPPEKTPSKVSLKGKELLKKSSRTDAGGAVDQQSANDPSSQQPVSKVCRKPSQSSKILSETVINEAISPGANHSPTETSIVVSTDRKPSDKLDIDASKHDFELINKCEIEKRASRGSLKSIQAQVYPVASENISQLDTINTEQTVADVEVSQEGYSSNEIDKGEIKRNSSRCSLLGEKSFDKLKFNKQEIIEVQGSANAETHSEDLGNELMTRKKSMMNVVSKSSLEGNSAIRDELRPEIDRRITESGSLMSFFGLKDSEPRNKSQDISIATQMYAAKVNPNGEKCDQSSASSVKNKSRNRFVDLMKRDRDNRSLLSSIKSIFKSSNKSELQKRRIANIEDQEKDIVKDQSAHLIEENAEIPVIQSMKSLQDNRKRSKNGRRHGHKLFDDESTSFATKDFAQNSYQAGTQSNFMQSQNCEEKIKDFEVDDRRNSFVVSIPSSNLQILQTDEWVEDKTAKTSGKKKESKKKQNFDGNMRKFAFSLSRIFRNSSRKKIGVKESRATVISQINPEYHSVITMKVPLPSSDNSNSQENDCNIVRPKSKTTGLDNSEEVVVAGSLDTLNDLDRDATRESIVKRSSTVLRSRYATNYDEATKAELLRQEVNGTVIFSAPEDVNRIPSENELAKESSLSNFQQTKKFPEKIYATKDAVVSNALMIESAKYHLHECDDPSNEDHQPEDHRKRSSGKSFAIIRKLFSRASIKNNASNCVNDDKDRDEDLINRYSESKTLKSNSKAKIRQSEDTKNSDVRIEIEARNSRESGGKRTADDVHDEIKCIVNCEEIHQKLENEHDDDVEASKFKSIDPSLANATRKSFDAFSKVGLNMNECSSIKSNSTNEDTKIESSASVALLIPETQKSIGFTAENNPESKTRVSRIENVTQNRPRSKTASRDFRLNPNFVSRSTIVMMATPISPRIEYQNDNSKSSSDLRDDSSTSQNLEPKSESTISLQDTRDLRLRIFN